MGGHKWATIKLCSDQRSDLATLSNADVQRLISLYSWLQLLIKMSEGPAYDYAFPSVRLLHHRYINMLDVPRSPCEAQVLHVASLLRMDRAPIQERCPDSWYGNKLPLDATAIWQPMRIGSFTNVASCRSFHDPLNRRLESFSLSSPRDLGS